MNKLKNKLAWLSLFVMVIASLQSNAQGLEGLIVERYYITDAADEANAIAQGAVSPLPVGSVAYRVYVDMAPGYKFSQIFGNAQHNLTVNTTSSFFNDPNYGVAVNPAAISVNNSKKHTALIDSWFTTGGAAATKVGVMEEDDTDGTIGNNQGILANNPGGCYGLPINGTNAQDGLVPSSATTYLVPNTLGLGSILDVLDQTDGNSITIANGTIAALGGIVGPTASNRVLIAQFTTNGVLSLAFNVQLVNVATGNAENYVASNPGAGELTHPTLTFISGNAPTANVLTPANNSNYSFGSNVPLTVNAADNGGVITLVEFYIDGNLVGSDTSSPYSFDYTATGGAQTFYAIVYDNDCLSAQTSTVNFSAVNNTPPTITLTAPDFVIFGNGVTFSAIANDPDGSVVSVEFFVDGVSVGVDNTSPYSLDYTPALGEGQVVNAVVTDNLGTSTTSNDVIMDVVENTAPEVAIALPLNGESFIANETIVIAADAFDIDGTVEYVEFYAEGVLIGTATSEPFQIDWIGEAGIITIEAIAFDDMDAQTTSESVEIFVIDPSAQTYFVGQATMACDENTVCVPVSVTETLPISDIIGFDFVISYDETKVQPTGVYQLFNDMANSAEVELMMGTPANGEVPVSLVFAAGSMSSFNGSGDLFCLEFERLAGFAPQDVAVVGLSSVLESYITGVEVGSGTEGQIQSLVDPTYPSALVHWADGSAIVYDEANPSAYLATTIEVASNDVVNASAGVVNPDLNGEFVTDFSFGDQIFINRDIDNTISVQRIVNAVDAVIAKTVYAQGSYVPSVYEMLAMDVNLDGVISAGDISQINQRAVLKLGEFMQAWNYDDQGVSNGEASRDWVFVPQSMVDGDAAYMISSTFPADDAQGFSIARVPVPAMYLMMNIENYSADFSTCALANEETYVGIMLGDIDASYLNYQADGVLRGSDAASLTFDATSPVYETVGAETFIEFPVQLNATQSVNAIDFWLEWNELEFEFDSIYAVQNNLEVEFYTAPVDGVTRVTASTSELEDFAVNNQNAFIVRLKVLNDCAMLTEDDLINVNVLVNGIEGAYEVLAPVAAPINFASVTNCALAPVEMSYGSMIFGQMITSYSWDYDNGSTGTGSDVEAEYTEAGAYTISVDLTTMNGCVYTVTGDVLVLNVPVASFTSALDVPNISASFNNTSFVVNSSIASSSWTFGDGNSSSDFSPSHIYGTGGIYDVSLTVTSADGCSATVTQQIELFTGVSENSFENAIQVYPNPFDTYIMIDASVNVQVQITDVTGRIVKETFLVVGGSKHSLDMNELAGGSYLVKCVGSHFEKTVVICHK
ncbi:MAG: Ig-like domain-containing protein [Flavobacteriales bacterium]